MPKLPEPALNQISSRITWYSCYTELKKNEQIRLSMIRLLLVLCCVGMLNACTVEDKAPLKLGTTVWPGYEPLYLAREKQFLNNRQVELVEFLSASEVMRAFRNGTIDIAALTLDEALSARQYKPESVVFLATDYSAGGDTVIAQQGISDAHALKGKRIGVENTALGAFMLARFLELSDLTEEDIELHFLEMSEHESAFLNGNVDAVVTYEPVKTHLISQGGRELFNSTVIPREIIDTLVTTPEVLAQSVSEIRGLVSAWEASLAYIRSDRQSALNIMAPRLRISPSELDKALQGVELLNLDDNRALLTGVPSELSQTAQMIEQVMRDHQLLVGAASTAPLVDTRFLVKE